MKKYRVVIHYEGAITYAIEANNAAEAETIAEREFSETPAEVIADRLLFKCEDCWRIQED